MKKQLVTLLSYILCHWAIAQQKPNTIEVSARTIYVDPEPIFTSEVILNRDTSLDPNAMTLDEIRENFKKVLAKNDLPWKNIKEHKGVFNYEAVGFGQEGILYSYKTTSIKEIKRFMAIKFPMLQKLRTTSSIEIDSEEAEEIIRITLDKTHKQAILLAKAMRRTIGKISSISTDTKELIGKPYETTLNYYRPPGEFFYDIEVTYELK